MIGKCSGPFTSEIKAKGQYLKKLIFGAQTFRCIAFYNTDHRIKISFETEKRRQHSRPEKNRKSCSRRKILHSVRNCNYLGGCDYTNQLVSVGGQKPIFSLSGVRNDQTKLLQ